MKNKGLIVSSEGRADYPAPTPTALIINKKAIRKIIGELYSHPVSKQVFIDLNDAAKRQLAALMQDMSVNGTLTLPDDKPVFNMLITSRIKKILITSSNRELKSIITSINLKLLEIIRLNAYRALSENSKVFKISAIANNSAALPVVEKTVAKKHSYYTFTYSLQPFEDELFSGKTNVRTTEGKDKAEKLFRQALEKVLYSYAGITTSFEIKILNVTRM